MRDERQGFARMYNLDSGSSGFLLDFLFGLLLLHGLGRFFLGFLLDIHAFAHGLHSSLVVRVSPCSGAACRRKTGGERVEE